MLGHNTRVLKYVNTSVVCFSNTVVLNSVSMKLNYGNRLRAARKNKKLSQQDLADISGVGQGSISKIERGDQDTSAYDVELSFALDVHPMWLKYGDDRFLPDFVKADYIEGEVLKSQIPYANGICKQDIVNEPCQSSYVAIRFGSFRLQAGIIGYSVDYLGEDKEPLFFRRDWLVENGFKEEKLVLCKVHGESMERSLFDGDVVLINTEQFQPKDGEVFAINYEGELLIKRMKRDRGLWYLSSDNPDKSRFPDKLCDGDFCIVIGEVVQKQSSRI